MLLLLHKLWCRQGRAGSTHPIPKLFLECQLPSGFRVLLAEHRKQKNRGFCLFCFSKSHREKPPLVLFAAVSAGSVAATPPKIPFGHGEKTFQSEEEKKMELQLLLRRLHIHSQPGFFQKKGEFLHKKGFFCLFFLIREWQQLQLLRISVELQTACSKKRWLKGNVPSLPCWPLCPCAGIPCAMSSADLGKRGQGWRVHPVQTG